MTTRGALTDDERLARIPRIVDLDAHFVEPAHVWSDRLPARFREVGPRVLELPAGTPKLLGAGYVEEPGGEGPPVAWWFYEDQRTSLKRTIAAAGYPADEVELRSVGYGDMRKGCYDPVARLGDMDRGHVEAQMCWPQNRGKLGRCSSGPPAPRPEP